MTDLNGALKITRTILFTLCVLCCFIAPQSAFGQYVYWTSDNGDVIGRVSVSGPPSSPAWLIGCYHPIGVAVDSNYIYWANRDFGLGTIGRDNLSGFTPVHDWTVAQRAPQGVAVDNNYVYFANSYYNAIGRVDVNGGGGSLMWISGCSAPYGVAVDENYVYWTNTGDDTIGRANLDGSGVNQLWITGSCNDSRGITVDENFVYWANFIHNDIGRADLDGSSPDEHWLDTGNTAYDVAVDDNYIYWTAYYLATIGRAEINGTNPDIYWVTSCDDYPAGITCSSEAPPTPLPTNTPEPTSTPTCIPGDITINAAGTGDFGTIQEGIDRICTGNTLWLENGTYTGVGNKNLDFGGRNFTVRSVSDNPGLCIIDCEDSGQGFYFHNNETTSAVVQGLTVRNGYASGGWPLNHGGGFCCDDASPQVINCVIEGCESSVAGGGVYFSGGSPVFDKCIIYQNHAGTHGGGFYLDANASPVITNCLIVENTCIENGAGLQFSNLPSADLINCTLSGNVAGGNGGGINCYNSIASITNCIFWGNSASSTNEIYINAGSTVTVNYCNVEGGYADIGNIEDDPLFVGGTLYDFHLTGSSPCIDTGTDDDVTYSNLPPDDFDGDIRPIDSTYDIGFDERLFTSPTPTAAPSNTPTVTPTPSNTPQPGSPTPTSTPAPIPATGPAGIWIMLILLSGAVTLKFTGRQS